MRGNMIPTITFVDGELIVESRFGEMRLRWLPEPRAVERGSGQRRWKPFWPEFRLVRDEGRLEVGDRKTEIGGQSDPRELAREAAFRAFRAQVPDDVAACGALFSSHQWPVMLM